jgi:phosphate:Na+ symporter
VFSESMDFMIKDILFFIAGLFIFLYGMAKLGEEVQRFFTVRIREYILYAVKKPLYGLMTGITSTIFFQSSSAVTVVTIGMVSAGLISFQQSLAIILGADIGTTLTVQLVVWKITDFAPALIMAGGVLWFTASGKRKTAGEAVFFFGLLFFGLNLMGMATAPLKQNPAIIGFFREAANPLLGIAAGAVFTAIVHSSLIPISLLVVLAQQGLISIEVALPIVIGANIGTTATALMAAATANISGKRTAAAHVLFKIGGTAICLLLFPVMIDAVKAFSDSTAQQIVFSHFLFNSAIVVAFVFILKHFARLVEKMIPGHAYFFPLWPEFLSDKDLADPEKALENVRRELEREILLTKRMFDQFMMLADAYKEGIRLNMAYMEMVVDNLTREIIRYLWQASCREFSDDLSKKLFVYTAMADDLERIGDHISSLAFLVRDKYKREIAFSAPGIKEMAGIQQAVLDNLKRAVSLTNRRDEGVIRDVHRFEDEIDDLVKHARENHRVRFHRRVCQAEAGPIFVEMLIHLERISDHCENIAEYVEELRGS